MAKLLIIGGDERQSWAAKAFKEKNIDVTIFDGDYSILNKKFDAVLLPIPVTKDNEYIYQPNNKTPYSLKKVLSEIPQETLVLGGAFNNDRVIDICSRDDFAYYNAVPTAEGAIAIALEKTKRCLKDSKILVVGFGRVGKILTERLSGFHPRLYVAARKSADFALLDTFSIPFIHTEKLCNTIKDFDIVFNTVEAPVFDENVLKQASQNTVFIELASRNMGFDLIKAEEYGINLIPAPSLPAKTAPISAGEILAETVLNILKESHYL